MMLKSKKRGWKCLIRGNEQINKAVAGVGTPMKELVWRVSMLNFANRIAEKIVIKKATKGTHSGNVNKLSMVVLFSLSTDPLVAASESNKNIITPGTTPKVTISANESSCFPISECTFKMRAVNPSKKSNTQCWLIRLANFVEKWVSI